MCSLRVLGYRSTSSLFITFSAIISASFLFPNSERKQYSLIRELWDFLGQSGHIGSPRLNGIGD